jgi:hypothetical protein
MQTPVTRGIARYGRLILAAAADFQGLLDWLQADAPNGSVVETTTQVIGGPVQPPVPA